VKNLLNFGEMFSVQAHLSPDRVGARDLERAMTLQREDAAKQNANLKSGLEAKDLIFNNVQGGPHRRETQMQRSQGYPLH